MANKFSRGLKVPMRDDVQIGPHRIVTDVSVEESGEGLGGIPRDLCVVSLGACRALTVLRYAQRKGIPLEDVDIAMERAASQEHAAPNRLSVVLTLIGSLTGAQKEELHNVAAKEILPHDLMTKVTTEIISALIVCARVRCLN